MKATTIITALAAAVLIAPTYAAPAASPTHVPSRNGTVTNDDAWLKSRIVDYDFEGMAKLAAQYEEAMGRNTLHRSNAVAKAAPSKDIIPFCVGIASNPVRVRVFRNKLTCSIKGWNTLFTFTAHTKKDSYLAGNLLCSALDVDETRSMFFGDKSTCGGGEWKHDFALYASTNVYTQTMMFTAQNPNRMLLYPTYPGEKHGWKGVYSMRYRSHFRLASNNEMKTFKGDYVSHLEVHKKLSVSSPSDAATLRCASLMAETIPAARLSTGKGNQTVQGKDVPGYAAFAYDAKCTDLVLKSTFTGNRVTFGGFGSIELSINGKTYAAVSMKQGLDVGGLMLKYALLESMRSGQPVMVSESNGYQPDDGIVAYVQGTAFIMGNEQIWDATI